MKALDIRIFQERMLNILTRDLKVLSKATFIGVILSMLIACGFQLKRDLNWPAAYKTVFITKTAPDFTSLYQLLNQRLSRERTLVQNPENADLTITLVSAIYRSRSIASGRNGQQREYVLTLDTIFSVQQRDGSFILSNVPIGSAIALQYDEANVLGRSEGESLSRTQLENDVINALLRQIRAQFNQQQLGKIP